MLHPIEEYAWATVQVRQLEASRLRLLAEARNGSAGTLRSHLARKLVAAGLRLDRTAADFADRVRDDAQPPRRDIIPASCD